MISVVPSRRSFGEGLIEEETASLWEPWMRQTDRVLEDEQLVNAVAEALRKRHPVGRAAHAAARAAWPPRSFYVCCCSNICATGALRSWNVRSVPIFCTGSSRASAPAKYQMLARRSAARRRRVRSRSERTDPSARGGTVRRAQGGAGPQDARGIPQLWKPNIHYPTGSSSLLGDGDRVLTRLMK